MACCHHKHDGLNLKGQKHYIERPILFQCFCCQPLTSMGRLAFCCTRGRKQGVRWWWVAWRMRVQMATQLFTELFMTGCCLLGRLTQIICNKRSNTEHKITPLSQMISKYVKNAYNLLRDIALQKSPYHFGVFLDWYFVAVWFLTWI